MLKPILILFFGLFIFQSARAQKQDTLLYYVKNSGAVTPNKDSADYFIFIMPLDSATKLYPVNEYYPNGKPKLIGLSQTRHYNALIFEGSCISFFSNGKKQSIVNYTDNSPGETTRYYPNGKLYTIEKYDAIKLHSLLTECRDSTGNILTDNGNGKWIEFDKDIKNEVEEGQVKNSLQDGEWHEIINGVAKYVIVYKQGVFVSTTDTSRRSGEGIFIAVDKEPEYKNGGLPGLYAFLGKTINYPPDAKRNGIQGKVLITFVVEKDGSLSDVKALRSPDKSLADEAIRAVMLSPKWIPGMQGVRPVRVQYTIPVSFRL
ncbi:TonB family C-terminal domain-containing protein [Mucilaginibacter mallensis]|uniref:TonB family C-terminal domain-containing protein n=1 Tax=Mucilaginibacter mallensis TaxID=652787 RepID=A0A1H1XL51_MUCMA|nr:energy transducer TonB [Mucilaginibacter mallensis]SDT09950.1 TonB family C-terminal domain-containing protein [Mucilaginibacter mallensis]